MAMNAQETNNACNALLILSVTRAGRTFRPTDWVDRLAGQFSSFGSDRLLKYSPSVRPVTVEEVRGLLVDVCLLASDPAAFRGLLDFAVDNDLTIQCLGEAAKAIMEAAGDSLPHLDALNLRQLAASRVLA